MQLFRVLAPAGDVLMITTVPVLMFCLLGKCISQKRKNSHDFAENANLCEKHLRKIFAPRDKAEYQYAACDVRSHHQHAGPEPAGQAPLRLVDWVRQRHSGRPGQSSSQFAGPAGRRQQPGGRGILRPAGTGGRGGDDPAGPGGSRGLGTGDPIPGRLGGMISKLGGAYIILIKICEI
jgi:hypothetical protein